jgi:hypothetical protein
MADAPNRSLSVLRGVVPTAGAALALAMMSSIAWAGGGALDGPDDHDITNYIGAAKDIDGNLLADVKVTADLKSGNLSLIARTDATGRYKIPGFAQVSDPSDVSITCAKEGYKLIRAIRRRVTVEPGTPVETDCLMAK